jgi:hypothetical protein
MGRTSKGYMQILVSLLTLTVIGVVVVGAASMGWLDAFGLGSSVTD